MTQQPSNGGPAFPSDGHKQRTDAGNWTPCTGMTLRDWFAGQALASQKPNDLMSFDQDAELAYAIADAMLGEREKRGEDDETKRFKEGNE